MKKFILGATLALASVGSQAAFFDGNDLLQLLKSSDQLERAVGTGYVMGAVDVGRGVIICTPPNVTSGQLKDIVIDFLEKYPTVRHFTADEIIIQLGNNLFPCKTPKKNTL